MPGFIQILENPDGGPDNEEAKWWNNWLGKKKEVHDKNSESIEHLRKQQINLQIQQRQTTADIKRLCTKYDELLKQLAAEERVEHKSEHRRLEVED
jgi:hypothetical protein